MSNSRAKVPASPLDRRLLGGGSRAMRQRTALRVKFVELHCGIAARFFGALVGEIADRRNRQANRVTDLRLQHSGGLQVSNA